MKLIMPDGQAIDNVTVTGIEPDGCFHAEAPDFSARYCNPEVMRLVDDDGNPVEATAPLSEIEKLKIRQDATEEAVWAIMMGGF